MSHTDIFLRIFARAIASGLGIFLLMVACVVTAATTPGTTTTDAPVSAPFAAKALSNNVLMSVDSAPASSTVGSAFPLRTESFSTDSFSGAFRMRLALDVPTGRGGVRPGLDVVHGGGAFAGTSIARKWSLSMPRVVRDSSRSYSFSADDFAFESGTGATVLASIGNGRYVERVRTSAFLRFERIPNADGTDLWVLTQKDGSRLKFGATAESRLQESGKQQNVVAWLPSEFEDIHGNRINYVYELRGVTPWLVRICYGANVLTPADKEIELEYEDLPRGNLSLSWGFPIEDARRLKAVHLFVNVRRVADAPVVRQRYASYRFEVDPVPVGGAPSLEQRVTQVVRIGEGVTTEVLYHFEHGDPAPKIVQTFIPSSSNSVRGDLTLHSWLAHARTDTIVYVDVNGDGQTDICARSSFGHSCILAEHLEPFSRAGRTSSPLLNRTDIGGAAFADSEVGKRPAPIVERVEQRDDETITYYEWSNSLDLRERLDGSLRYPDLDGDGQLDICGLNASGLTCLVDGNAVVTPAEFREGRWWAPKRYASFRTGDVNGDGADELCALSNGTFSCWTLVSGALTPLLSTNALSGRAWETAEFQSTIVLVDVNGDHRADLCGRFGEGLRCWRSDGTAFAAEHPVLSTLGGGSREPRNYRNIHYGDLNGDGATDVCALLDRVSCWLGSPSGFVREVSAPAVDLKGWNEEAHFATLRLLDFNGDRKDDLCARQGAQIVCWLSLGVEFGQPFVIASIGKDWNEAVTLRGLGAPDFDGDGKRELCLAPTPKTGAITGLACWSNVAASPELLLAFRNAFGAETRIGYSNASRTIDNRIPFSHQVVTTVTTRDGYGGIKQTSMRYSGGYFSKASRDFRGFRTAVRVEEAGIEQTGTRGASSIVVDRSSVTETEFHQGDTHGNRNAPVAYMKGLPRRLTVESDAGYQDVSFSYYPPDPNGSGVFFTPMFDMAVALCDGIQCRKPLPPGSTPAASLNRLPSVADASVVPYLVSLPGRGSSPVDFGHREALRAAYEARLERWNKRFRLFRTEYAYDAYANLAEEIQHGAVDDATDDRRIVRQFTPLAGGRVLDHITKETWLNGLSGNAVKLREVTLGYDEHSLTTDVVADCAASFGAGGAAEVRGNLTSVTYWLDRKDLARSKADPVEHRAYDRFGNLRCTRDADNAISAINLDSSATFPRFFRNPLGHTVELSMHGVDGYGMSEGRYGQIGSVKDANGVPAELEYDGLGRLVRQRQANGYTVEYGYRDIGSVGTQQLEVKDSLNNRREYRFDGFGRIRRSRWNGPDGQLLEQQVEFDDRGYPVAVSVPAVSGQNGATLWFRNHWDEYGRPNYQSHPDGRTVTHCYEDWAVHAIDQHGVYSKLLLDSRRRVRESSLVVQPADSRLSARYSARTGIDLGHLAGPNIFEAVICTPKYREYASYSMARYDYDALDRLSGVSDPVGTKSTFSYDSLGRLTGYSDPDRGVWQHAEFDGAGRAWSTQTPLGTRVSFTYDALGRMLTRKVGGQAALSTFYSYDVAAPNSLGRLSSVSNAGSADTFEYDPLGRITGVTRTIGNRSYRFVNTYDPMGRLAARTYPDGRRIELTHEGPALRKVELAAGGQKVPVAGFGDFLPTGDPRTVAYANGVKVSSTYGGFGTDECARSTLEICTIRATDGNGTVVADLEYEFSVGGSLLQTRDSRYGDRHFVYDSYNRLISEQGPVDLRDVGATYEYDKADRIVSGPEGMYRYETPGPNVRRGASRIGSNALRYNRAGAVTQIRSATAESTFQYDALGRLTGMDVRQADAAKASRTEYVYDWSGAVLQRSRSDADGSEATMHPADDYECRGEECVIVLRRSGGTLARLPSAANDATYFVNDHLGSAIAFLNADAGVGAEYRYQGYGGIWQTGAPKNGNPGFLGEYAEAGGSAYLLGSRVLHPQFGIFLAPDPYVVDGYLPGGMAPYRYAFNNPLGYQDRSGWSGESYFHPGWGLIASGVLAVGGVIIFGTFATIPATALGAILLTGEAVGVAGGGVQVVLGGISFFGSRKDAEALSDAMSFVPTSAMQFAALPIALMNKTAAKNGAAETLKRVEAMEVMAGMFLADENKAGEALYKFAAFGIKQFMERKENPPERSGLDRASFSEIRSSRGDRGGDGGSTGRVSIGSDLSGASRGQREATESRVTVESFSRSTGESFGKEDAGPQEKVSGERPVRDPREIGRDP